MKSAFCSKMWFCPLGHFILVPLRSHDVGLYNRAHIVGQISSSCYSTESWRSSDNTSLKQPRDFMGTAVLFPQDCLRPRSRHKHQTPVMIYPSECAPRSKKNLPHPTQSQEAGLLPLPGRGARSVPMNILRRGSDTNHFKCKKGLEQRDIDLSPKSTSDVPVYRILQRPKQGDVAVNLLTQFVMLDGVKAQSVMAVVKSASSKEPQSDGLDYAGKGDSLAKTKLGTLDISSDGVKHKIRGSNTKPVKVGNEGVSVCQPKDALRFHSGVHTPTVDGYKPSNTKMGGSKSNNVSLDEVLSGLDDPVRPSHHRVAPKPFKTKATGKINDTSCKAVIVRRSEEPHSLPCLRRTSTEPQISTNVLGQYKSKVMHISFDYSNSESHARGRGFSGSYPSLSCKERWAGPAYTSSPAPSSLPLPKLCLPHTRFSSLEVPPLVKQYSTSVYLQPFLGSSAPSENGGAWDAAFATKSLRKMLNLDPC